MDTLGPDPELDGTVLRDEFVNNGVGTSTFRNVATPDGGVTYCYGHPENVAGFSVELGPGDTQPMIWDMSEADCGGYTDVILIDELIFVQWVVWDENIGCTEMGGNHNTYWVTAEDDVMRVQ